jgi:hypothetical protein
MVMLDPTEIISAIEAEVERLISIQRDIVGGKGTNSRQDIFTSRTQLRHGEK